MAPPLAGRQCLRPRRRCGAGRDPRRLCGGCAFLGAGNTGLATENYNVAFWDHESKISFVYEQYGALAHSLLNGRLDLMQDPPEELLALDNPYDSTAREAARSTACGTMLL